MRRPRPLPSRSIAAPAARSEEHTSELQSRGDLVCRLLLEKKKDFRGLLDVQPGLWRVRGLGRECYPNLVRARVDLDAFKRSGLERFFFNATATADTYTLSLHDALPI